MLLAHFERQRFANDVHRWCIRNGLGARQRILRETGISTGSMARFFYTTGYVKDIEMIFSVAAVCELRVEDYISVKERIKDWIIV